MAVRLKKRHRLRKKEIKTLSETLTASLGRPCFSLEDNVDWAETGKFPVLISNGEILGMIIDGAPFPTVKGLLRFDPEKKYVTIDMGAVKFIYNGADVMCPGIVDADEDIASGDLVWVRDEKNFRPLAVGKAMMSGREMKGEGKGKAVKSLHHVGDEIWSYEV